MFKFLLLGLLGILLTGAAIVVLPMLLPVIWLVTQVIAFCIAVVLCFYAFLGLGYIIKLVTDWVYDVLDREKQKRDIYRGFTANKKEEPIITPPPPGPSPPPTQEKDDYPEYTDQTS